MTLTAISRPEPPASRSFDLSMARSTALVRRLTPEWQDEAGLLAGLKSAEIQFFLVTRTGLAERRRVGGFGGLTTRWQLRLKG
jgi:hypothetical protein